MLDDPLVLISHVGAATTDISADDFFSMVCTGRGPTSSTYRYDISATHWIEAFIGHQYGRRNRYTARLTESEVVADPIDSTKNSILTESVYVVCDRALTGATSNQTKMLTSLAMFLLAGTDFSAPFVRVLGGET
jgi:hypothetical protein